MEVKKYLRGFVIDEDLRLLLSGAESIAEEMESDEIGTQHVLLSLLSYKEDPLTVLLLQNRLDVVATHLEAARFWLSDKPEQRTISLEYAAVLDRMRKEARRTRPRRVLTQRHFFEALIASFVERKTEVLVHAILLLQDSRIDIERFANIVKRAYPRQTSATVAANQTA